MNRLFYLIALVLIVGTFGCSPESTEKELAQLNSKVSVMESKAERLNSKVSVMESKAERLTIAESQVRALNTEVRMLREKVDNIIKSKPDSSVANIMTDNSIARQCYSLSERLNRVELSISQIKEAIAQPVLPGCLGFEEIDVNGTRRRQPCRCMAYAGDISNPCLNCQHYYSQHTRSNK
jgi:outer membrane murein-binding lipoprotein Lpp